MCKDASISEGAYVTWHLCISGPACLYTDYNTREATGLPSEQTQMNSYWRTRSFSFSIHTLIGVPVIKNEILPLYGLIKLPVQTSLQLQE